MPHTDRETPLRPSEEQRLDSLLAAARSAHHLSVVIAATTVAIASSSSQDNVVIPLIAVSLPRIQSGVALLLLVTALAAVSDRMFREALEWLHLDKRRPTYPWFALGWGNVNNKFVTLWLAAPIVVTALAITAFLELKDGGFLPLAAVFLAFMPRLIDKYLPFLNDRRDRNEEPATLSIWLLYAYRVGRHLLTSVVLLLLVFASVPDWHEPATRYAFLGFVVLLAGVFVRAVAGFASTAIDRFGTKLGFPVSPKTR